MAAAAEVFAALGLGAENLGCYDGTAWRAGGALAPSVCPSTGAVLAQVQQGTVEDYEACMAATVTARRAWAETPAPARGEVVRKIGEALRAKKQALGTLIALEMGKVLSEGLGEVQGEERSRAARAAPRKAHPLLCPPSLPPFPSQSSLTSATWPWASRAC